MNRDLDLALRAVACKGWQWLPGMLSRCSTDTRRAVYRWLLGLDTRHYGLVCIVQDKHGRPCRSVATLQPGPDDLPDLTDPATLGCLLALVRKAWGDPALSVTAAYTKDRTVEWEVEHPHPDSLPGALWTYFDTEAAALVAALEAAP